MVLNADASGDEEAELAARFLDELSEEKRRPPFESLDL